MALDFTDQRMLSKNLLEQRLQIRSGIVFDCVDNAVLLQQLQIHQRHCRRDRMTLAGETVGKDATIFGQCFGDSGR